MASLFAAPAEPPSDRQQTDRLTEAGTWKPHEWYNNQAFTEAWALRACLLWPFSQRCFCYGTFRLTWGEALLWLPATALLCLAAYKASSQGNIEQSGNLANIPVNLVFLLAGHKVSPFAFLLGMPLERALWYHKFFAFLVLLMGAAHGLTAWETLGCPSMRRRRRKTISSPCDRWSYDAMMDEDDSITGIIYWLIFFALILTSLPPVRRILFEYFYVSHIVLIFAALIIGTAHGAGSIMIGATVWMLDLVVRYVYMAGLTHTQNAQAVALPGDVVRYRHC